MQVVLGAPGYNCSNKSIFRRGKWTQAWTQSILCYCVVSFHTLYVAAIIGKHPYTVTLRTCECVTSAASISQVPTSHLPVQASKTSLSFKVSQCVSVCTENWCSRRLKVLAGIEVAVGRVCGGACFQNLKTLLELFCRQIVQMNRQCLMGFTVRKWRRCNSSPFLSQLIHMETHCSLRPDSATIAALCILQQFVVTLLRVFGKPHCLLSLMSACVTG